MSLSARAGLVLVGASLGWLAIARGPSVLGGLAWTVAVAIACHGYGVLVERLTHVRVSPPLTIAAGLAALLVVSTILARSGLLSRTPQLVALLLGLVACAVPRRDHRSPRAPGPLLVFTLAAAAVMVVIAIVHDLAPTTGGSNHVLAIKRLWDTGSFGVLRQQLGFGLVGEAYAAWATGAQIAAVFELAWCPALVIGILAYELPAQDRALGVIGFIVLGIPLALFPAICAQWSGAFLLCAAFFTLGPAIAARRTGWHTVLFAVALCAVRNELVIVGAPYVAAAIFLPRAPLVTRGRAVGAIAVWGIGVIGFQVALGIPANAAFVNALELLLVLPIVALVLYLLGVESWRSAFAVHWFVCLSMALGVVVGAVRDTQHSPDASVIVWLSLAIGSLTFVTHRSEARSSRALGGAAAGVLALVMGIRGFDPAFNGQRWGIAMRHAHALLWLQEQMALGSMTWVHEDVRSMQERIPPGVPMLFWGRSAGLLDFNRNPIRDVSWLSAKRWRPTDFLARLTPAHLAGGQYLVVEELEPSTPLLDPWTTHYIPATKYVLPQLEELGRAGIARLYRIK